MKKWFIEEIDKKLAILGLFIGLLAIFLSLKYHLNREHLGMAVILGSCLYLIGRKSYSRRKVDIYKVPRWIVVGTFITFFSLIVFSETVARDSVYHRSLGYILLVLGAVIVCITQILFFVGQSNSRWVETAILVEICLLSISVKASAFFLYPSVSGGDSFFHLRVIQSIMTQGVIPVSSYQSLPLMHLIGASFSLITQLPSRFGIFYISILQSLAAMGVFFIGRGISDNKTGLVAAILFSLSDYAIQWGVEIIPMTIGATIFTLILIGVFQRAFSRDNRGKIIWTALIIIFCASVIVTHSIASLITLVSLITLAIISSLYSLFSKSKDWVTWSLTILFCVGLFTYWMYAFADPGLDFFSLLVRSAHSALATAEVGDVSSVSVASEYGYTSILLSEMGWSILFTLAIAGLFESLTNRFRQPAAIMISALSIILLAVIYVGAIVGANAILPDRWFIFLYVPATAFSAYTLSKFLLSKNILLKSSGIILVIVVCFFMITQPTRAMPDSPLYASELSNRPGFYSSELVGMDYVISHYGSPCKIAASSKTRLYLSHSIQLDPRKPETYLTANVIVVRINDIEKGIFIPFEPGRAFLSAPLTPDFANYLASINVHRSYDNGEVNIYTAFTCGQK